MTYEKMQKALRELDAMILAHPGLSLVVEAERSDASEGCQELEIDHAPHERLGHARWMIQEALSFPREKTEKGMRWLGFVQGVMWMHGWSIDNMKHVNMPDDEKPSAPDVWPGDAP